MPDKKAVIDHADAREKISDYRKLKHHAKGQNQARYDRKVVTHLNQWLYLNGFIPAQQKFESELQENFIAKKSPGKKKKRSEKNEAPRVAFFVLVETRGNELPSVPQENRQSDDDCRCKRHFHFRKEGFRNSGTDEGESGDIDASNRGSEQREKALGNGKTAYECDTDRKAALYKAGAELCQVGGKGHLHIRGGPVTLALVHFFSSATVAGDGEAVSDGFSRCESSLFVESVEASSISCSIWRSSSLSSSVARRNSAIPLPRARASSGSFLGPSTMSARARIKTSSGMPMPNMSISYSILCCLSS